MTVGINVVLTRQQYICLEFLPLVCSIQLVVKTPLRLLSIQHPSLDGGLYS